MLMRPARGLLELHTAVLLFGFAGLFGKWLTLHPLLIVAGRTLTAALALWLVLRWRGQSLRLARRRDGVALALAGMLLALHWVAFFQAIQLTTVALGLLTFASFPLFVTVLEPLVFREKWRAVDGLTALGVLLGLWLVTPSFDPQDRTAQGVAWGVLSGFSFALLALVNRGAVARYSALVIGTWQNSWAFLCLLPLVLLMDWTLSGRELALLVVLGVVGTALAHVLFISSLSQVRAQLASVISGLEPVYGAGLALLLLGEIPAPRTLAGGAVILGTTLLAVRYRSQK